MTSRSNSKSWFSAFSNATWFAMSRRSPMMRSNSLSPNWAICSPKSAPNDEALGRFVWRAEGIGVAATRRPP